MCAYRWRFPFPLISFCLSIALSVYFSLPFIVMPHSTLPLSRHRVSYWLFSFQKFLLDLMGIFSLKSFSPVLVNNIFQRFYHLLPAGSSQGSLLVVSVPKAWTAASNDKRRLLGRWVHFKCRVMFQAAQQRTCASYGLIRKAWCWCAAAWEVRHQTPSHMWAYRPGALHFQNGTLTDFSSLLHFLFV